MRPLAKNAARPWGFTLVELLTVIAIIAVLATLTTATLSNAQRKGRKAVSTSNLRQIAVAFNLYSDDHGIRPMTFRQMAQAKYLTERVILCPEDRILQNWAGMLEGLDTARLADPFAAGPDVALPGAGRGEETGTIPEPDLPRSYFKSFDYQEPIWQNIDRSTFGGIAACQLHGIGRQSKDAPPSIRTYQGLVLRALKDGSVVPRQVFWPESDFDSAVTPAQGYGGTNLPANSQLPLFLDPTE